MNDQSLAEVVFFAALEKASPAERAAYLDEACANDDALRRRVESLLEAHPRVGEFLERPVLEAAGAAALGGVEDAAADLSFLAPSAEPGSLGRLDHYEVLEVVGHGGTGIVLRCRDAKLLRIVALKVLAPALAASGTARRRFVREARAAAAIRDDHIIAIHAVEDQGPVPYLVMEFIDGCTLETLIRQGGPLEVPAVLRIGIQIARGLAAAHQQGLIHRDIKPANILLENGVQRVRLTDFGLARAADDASLTQSGFIAGTPNYMSPEQVNGDPIDHRGDLFSLGSVLYEMCTGRAPFRAPNTAAVLRRVAEEPPRPIPDINPDVPEPLCRLIERLHAKNPADRPASAQEVADLLAEMLAGLQTHGALPRSSPAGKARSAPRNGAARRWRWAAAALLLLVAGLGLSEATGVTGMGRSVIRLFSPEGTLVVEVDDPAVRVTLEGADLVITGAGSQEIRLKPGSYTLLATKDGKLLRQELVSVARDGRQVVRISKEPKASEVWEESVAALPPAQQVEAVAQRLKELNPGFDGQVTPTIRGLAVTGLTFNTDAVRDIAPVRALRYLGVLDCRGTPDRGGKLADLSPLRGLSLSVLHVEGNPVSDLSPLRGMPLKDLGLFRTRVEDLTPLRGMPLISLGIGHTGVSDLSPLAGMALTHLYCDGAPVSDLSPLRGMPLEVLYLPFTRVSDLSPLRGMALIEVGLDGVPAEDLSPLDGMPLKSIRCDFRPERDTELLRSLRDLETINGRPAAEFWEDVPAG
jgi:tRNA A-37 threonylcarbamoyl transferase component Bud32